MLGLKGVALLPVILGSESFCDLFKRQCISLKDWEGVIMDTSQLPGYIKFLLDGSVYPHPVDGVELLQTHISYITIAGDFVYKWKKPADFGFLDFTSLKKRKFYCEEEIRLNRRLCSDVYLDTVAVTRQGHKYQLAGKGDVVEYGVKMRRLPEALMMGRVIKKGKLIRDHLDRIIKVLVAFYQKADCGDCSFNYGNPDAIAKLVNDNFYETRRFAGSESISRQQFNTIRAYSAAFLTQRELFQKRVEAGRIRECHGDLHSGNICLTENIDIFDCIEFNESLRYVDVASDVAFLAMDLDFHRLGDLSDYFIARFIEKSGDQGIMEVLDFYKCYRAYVRGKIYLLTAAEPEVDNYSKIQAMQKATKYFTLSERYGVIR